MDEESGGGGSMDSGVDCMQLVLVVERADAMQLSACMHSRTVLLRLPIW
jgi:hypothetical protein